MAERALLHTQHRVTVMESDEPGAITGETMLEEHRSQGSCVAGGNGMNDEK